MVLNLMGVLCSEKLEVLASFVISLVTLPIMTIY